MKLEQTVQKPKAKPRGAPQNVREKMARLDVLAHKAIRFWERTLDESSDATTGEKIQVSKLVVEYAWGKPKQQVQVDAKVEINHKAHVEALVMLANAANGPVIDANPLNLLDNPSLGPNADILATPRITETPVKSMGQVEFGSALVGRAGAEPGSNDPPPDTRGTPGGGIVIEQAPPLDIKNDE